MLSVAETTRVLEAARAEAEKHQWAVAIVVVDDGGHPLGLLRLDGSAPASSYIATEKARTAAIGRRETKLYEDMMHLNRRSMRGSQATMEH